MRWRDLCHRSWYGRVPSGTAMANYRRAKSLAYGRTLRASGSQALVVRLAAQLLTANGQNTVGMPIIADCYRFFRAAKG
jgi:hypothetical protein